MKKHTPNKKNSFLCALLYIKYPNNIKIRTTSIPFNSRFPPGIKQILQRSTKKEYTSGILAEKEQKRDLATFSYKLAHEIVVVCFKYDEQLTLNRRKK